MVLAVCGRLLGQRQDAEDAAQAVFLALAKKAGTLAGAGSVAGWLHQVAMCAARDVYRARKRRQAREEEAAKKMIQEQTESGDDRETLVVLHGALAGLPEKYRLPIVLHHLEGKSYEAAAELAGCKAKAFSVRLARGMEILRGKLARRGLTVSAAALAGMLAKETAAAAASEAFVTATVNLACGWVAAGQAAAGGALVVPAQVAEITKGVLNMLFWSQVKVAAAVAVGVVVLGGGMTATKIALGGEHQPQPAEVKTAPEINNKPNAKTSAPAAVAAGEDPFGYTDRFDEELKKIGQISPAEFAKRYPSGADYLPKLDWDPTTAKFWNDFNLDPKTIPYDKPRRRNGRDDFRLSEEELAAFKQNGFVVSERLGATSFAEIFYRIYSRDLPVFLSSDALLHAWHRSYDAILEQLEETYLAQSLDEILSGMAARLTEAGRQYGKGVLAESVSDADYFLAVGLSLLRGQAVKCQLGGKGDERVAETLAAVEKMQMQAFKLFGRDRETDFSQFKPRGHYENSELLKRYFKAMMWCGRIDLRVASNQPEVASARELGAAVVLNDLLKGSGRFGQWAEFDRFIQTFVGWTDSMTFAQLDGVLAQGGIAKPGDLKDLKALVEIQRQILAGKIGAQHIRSDCYVSSPFGPDKAELPRSFTVLGQKFVLDSWVTAKTVADDVIWDGGKVQRRVPSCLDVAFATLANNQAVPLLVERMTANNGRKFRDGLNYQHNLAAVRNVIDGQDAAIWEQNLYLNWLGCLRELSKPTTAAEYPQVMRTKAWGMKTLNTQLASWSQLRHDTILYVKQSYTASAVCYYPAGFVEPRVEFWRRFEKMAGLAAKLIEKTPYPDRVVEKKDKANKVVRKINLKELQKSHAAFFREFGKQLAIIAGIAEKELAQKELTKEELKFLEDIVQLHHGSGFTRYDGWYPGMFYKGREDSGKWDAIVADVHTDVPCPLVGDPGCVLHQGVGNVNLMLIAVENGTNKMVFAGPVLSHYEFEMPGVSRKADSEWRKEMQTGKLPECPAWTKSYLVPCATNVTSAISQRGNPNDD